jgi:hypothetical protein
MLVDYGTTGWLPVAVFDDPAMTWSPNFVCKHEELILSISVHLFTAHFELDI